MAQESGDDSDDEQRVVDNINSDQRATAVEAMKDLTPNVITTSQKRMDKISRNKLAKQRCVVNKLVARVAQVKEEIENGTIHPPEPGEGCVWSLFGSGSAINAADHRKHFPGTAVTPEENPSTYQSATGQPFKSKGHYEIPFLSENRHKRSTHHLGAPAPMPITSSNDWARKGFRSTLDADCGNTLEKSTGLTDPLIVMGLTS